MAGIADSPPSRCARCNRDVPAGAAFCPYCGAAAPGRREGPRLAGYTIVRLLGKGGAAVVYLATQESLGRQVAVKVLRREVDDPTLWRYFQREARTIARLSGHPNVVTVYTAGLTDEGQPYFVTEYLERGSLADVIAANGPLPPPMVASIGTAVADALIAAHRLGIHHRDVKPGNVLLGEDGRVKLGDFGIARLLAGRSTTTTDVVAFTPEHVAPEILRGEPDGPWSDLYGLASTLAEALTGGPPFARRPDELLEALLSRKLMELPPPLPSFVPAPLATLIAIALEPDPRQRPSLTEFRDGLASAARAMGAPLSLLPPIPGTRTTPHAAPARSHEVPEVARRPAVVTPNAPLVGPIHRRRRRLLAIPALLLVMAGITATAVFARHNRDGQTSATSVPVTIASSAPIASPPESSPAATSSVTTAPATTVLDTAPPPATQPPDPTTTAPPSTTAPTTTAPAATAPASVPQPTSSVAPTGAISPTDVDTFLRTYYAEVAAGDYESSWSQLAPEFQQGRAQSFEYYVGFWDDNDVALGEIDVVAASADHAVANVELFWNGSLRAVAEQFTIRRGDGGELLIARETA